MSTVTNNLKLVKYDPSDKITPNGFNDNFDKLDGAINDLRSDYIVSQGESGIWSYRRWNSKFMELFATQDITYRVNETWNWCFYDTNVKGGVEFPTEFKVSRPNGTISISSSNGYVWLTTNTNSSASKSPTVYVCSAQKYDFDMTGVLYYHFWGWVK